MDLRIRPLLLTSAAVGLLISAGPAAAASSVTSGWWTTSPLLVAPDVADGQLLVQGGSSAEEPAAYAGISFLLGEDEEPASLTLTVAPDAASTPGSTLSLCALDAPAADAAGKPAEGAPAPDCSTAVEAEPSEDGTTYTFEVTAFAADGSLDVAVLPGQVSDRVVFEAPTVTSLRSAGGSGIITDGFDSGGFSAPAPTPSPAPPASAGATRTGGSTGSFDAPRTTPTVSVPRTSSSPPVPEVDATAAEEVQDEDELAAPLQPAPFEPAASTSPPSGSSAVAVLLALGLAAAAATLWMLAGKGASEAVVG